jgi:hypothetical protein
MSKSSTSMKTRTREKTRTTSGSGRGGHTQVNGIFERIWNLRAVNSGWLGSSRATRRNKVRRIRSPRNYAAETPRPRPKEKKPCRYYFGTGFKTNAGSATASSSPPSRGRTRAASCAEMPQAHAKATHVLAKRQIRRQWSCQVRGCPVQSRAQCRRIPTPCGARRQAAGNAMACRMPPIKRTSGSLCLRAYIYS